MARRRRSRSSLAGSPAHHAAKVKTFADAALKQYAAATEAASQGRCITAFRAFTTAVENDGKAGAHYAEAYGSRGARTHTAASAEVETELAHNRAYHAFDVHCLVSKPRAVSGLAGRRSSKRK